MLAGHPSSPGPPGLAARGLQQIPITLSKTPPKLLSFEFIVDGLGIPAGPIGATSTLQIKTVWDQTVSGIPGLGPLHTRDIPDERV